jgi:hypothetical protein
MKARVFLRVYILIVILSIAVQTLSIIDKAIDVLHQYSETLYSLSKQNLKRAGSSVSMLEIDETILKENLKGNILILEKYALIPQNNDEYPWIIRLNLETAET